MTVFTTFIVTEKSGAVPEFDFGEFVSLSEARVWAAGLLRRQPPRCNAEIFAGGCKVGTLTSSEATVLKASATPRLRLLDGAPARAGAPS